MKVAESGRWRIVTAAQEIWTYSLWPSYLRSIILFVLQRDHQPAQPDIHFCVSDAVIWGSSLSLITSWGAFVVVYFKRPCNSSNSLLFSLLSRRSNFKKAFSPYSLRYLLPEMWTRRNYTSPSSSCQQNSFASRLLHARETCNQIFWQAIEYSLPVW